MKNDAKLIKKGYLISALPCHERPRERLLTKGADALSDVELLAIVLRTGAQGKSTLDLARQLLQHFDGNLSEMAAASPAELAEIRGIGRAKTAELKATFAIASRLASAIISENKQIDSPIDAAIYLRERFRGKKQEELRILLLNTKNIIIRDELVTIGLLDRSPAHAREVFRAAIQYSASKLILAHNHPSGDPIPSKKDISCTKELIAAGKIVGIEIVDHIIIGQKTDRREKDFFSFQENELIT